MRLQILTAHVHQFIGVGIDHRGADAGEFFDDGQAAERHIGIRVAALMGRHEAAAA